MNKKEIAEKVLNLISFGDMLEHELKKDDDRPTFCDFPEYKESKAILEKAAIGILNKKDER